MSAAPGYAVGQSGGGGMSGANYGASVNDVGSAVGDLFSAQGAMQSAAMYNTAAAAAQVNVQVEQGNIVTQEAQGARQLSMMAGTQMAETSAAGFSGTSSTAQALEFANKSQFSINLHTQVSNDVVQENAYAQQVSADKAMAQVEKTKAEGDEIGAGFSMAASVASAV
jgi:hypothetical protein